MLYHVYWEIEVDAESHREAAEKVRAIQQDPGSIAHVYRVTEMVNGPGEPSNEPTVEVDLDEDERTCRECGGGVVDDPDGSEGVLCHADTDEEEGADIDRDHVPILEE